MTRSVLVALSLACGWGTLLPAQTPIEPRLVLTVLAGYRVGRPLWTLNRQPFAVLVPSPGNPDTTVVAGPGIYDTLDLRREFGPSFIVGMSGTYFPGPHLGFQGEIAFLAMGLVSRCVIDQYQPAYPDDVNPQLCATLDRQTGATSAVSLSFGVVGRLTPGRGVYPYARAGAGVITRTRGTIEMVGVYQTSNGPSAALVLADPNPVKTALHLTVGAGVAFTVGTGYQLWLEGRDVMAQLQAVTGLADPSGATGTLIPPHGGRLLHNFVFAVGLDVVFEKQRRRRY